MGINRERGKYIDLVDGKPVEKETVMSTIYEGQSEHGKSTVDIECGFCGEEVTAYIWSLAGSGKLCPCGAKHTKMMGTLQHNRKEKSLQKE